jgi:hypothetical protein
MQLRSPPRASVVALVEELVAWRCRIRDIVEVVGESDHDVECYARRVYERLPSAADRRPPAGPIATVSRKRLRITELRGYVGLAADYQNLCSRGLPPSRARVVAYRNHFQNTRTANVIDPAAWFGLCKKIDRRESSLSRCPQCTGLHLQDHESGESKCCWCGINIADVGTGLRMVNALPAEQVELIEELVSWRCRIKDIEWILRAEGGDVEACARALYVGLQQRPPNGAMGTATSVHLSVSQFNEYTAIATDYQNLLRRKVPRDDAMLVAYRFYFQTLRREAKVRADPSVWFRLSRFLDAGNAALVRCMTCSGMHLVERISERNASKCSWCGGKLGFHSFGRPSYGNSSSVSATAATATSKNA